MINKAQAVNLQYGDEIHADPCIITIGPRGGETLKQERWRVSGKCKTWKRSPDRFHVPIKYGLYRSHYIDNHNAHSVHLAVECAPFHQCFRDECSWQKPCESCYARNVEAKSALKE